MLVDIMSGHSYIMVNTKAVKIFGLTLATYWAVLADIYPRVIEKKLDELTSTGYFELKREYVESQCGLKPEEQCAMDQALSRIGVLAVDPNNINRIAIDMSAMAEILLEDDTKVLKKFQKAAKSKKTDEAAAKRQGKVDMFSGFAATLTHDPGVQNAYKLWVEAIIEGKRTNLTKGMIQIFHETLSAFTTDPQYQIKLIREAAAAGYTNVSWVLPKSRPAYATITPATRINAPQKESVGISEETF